MSALIIKLSKEGSSQEFLFQSPGPLLIGSDERCDLRIDDSSLPLKLLEVKLSGGNVFLKEISHQSKVFLEDVVLPQRTEVSYREGQSLLFGNGKYSIQIQKKDHEIVEPPPFFEAEFKERLERINARIHDREKELKALDSVRNKKKEQMDEMDLRHQRELALKNRLELEVGGLRSQKETLVQELRRVSDKKEEQEGRLIELRDFMQRLEGEERQLKETIVAQSLILNNLKADREKKSQEIESQRSQLASVQFEKSAVQTQLQQLGQDIEDQRRELKHEEEKVHQILTQSEQARREGVRIQGHIAELMKQEAVLDHQVQELQLQVTDLNKLHQDLQNRLQDLKVHIDQEESCSRKIQEEIQRHQEDEANLRQLNSELRGELIKAEEKLAYKKNQINQAEFQNQDVVRKLSTLQFELESASSKLIELSNEEKVQERRMLSLREEMQSMSRKAIEDKNHIQKQLEVEKNKLSLEIGTVKAELEEARRAFAKTEAAHQCLRVEMDELDSRSRLMQKEKQLLDQQAQELRLLKSQAEGQIQSLKDETIKLEHEKSRAQREFSQLQIKLMDCETQIKERMQEAHLEMENFKRDERSKILAEKAVHLAEVETFKQKSLIEVENDYRRKQQELYQLKLDAQGKVDEILQEARRKEAAITDEAQARLRQATEDAQSREVSSHQRIKEAQDYFKLREAEADAILQKSRLESRELYRKAEGELLSDLSNRKQKIKNFLSMKQNIGLAHLKQIQEQHLSKMRKQEERGLQKIEDLKRKELKRIARLREEEVTRQSELKNVMSQELKVEREKALTQIKEMRLQQEAELAEKKKTILEHINSTKYAQRQKWEAELRNEKEHFEQHKKERLSNATQAVMNILVAENGPQGEKETTLRQKIHASLEMAIDGQSADAKRDVDHILDMNPVKRKKILPVLRKYSFRVAVPAAIAIVFLGDIGSLRTTVINQAKDLLRQQQSASEIYVSQQKTEWIEKHTYNPVQTEDYKPTYVENVIYTVDFVKVMDNEEFQNDWILKVHDYMVKELELSEDVAISFISSEGTLIKDLASARKDLHPQHLEQGLKKMTDLEATHLGWLKEKIPDTTKMGKFVDFRKSYYEQFYQTKIKQQRGVATESK